jgi:hypothetical protein
MPRLLPVLALLLIAPLAFAAPQRAIVHLADEAVLTHVAGDSRAVIHALQETARTSQEPLVKRLTARGAVIEARLWATNAIVLRAEPAQLAELERDPAVAFVETDKMIPLPKVEEGDIPAMEEGEIVWSVQKINAPAVWADQSLTGEGVVVGLIDTGIDATHPDLAGKVVAFKDFIGSSTTPVDGQGHGTHCAGTIGGAGKGGKRTGVAPAAKFVVARVFGAQGASTATLLKAMEWVMDPDGNPSTNDAPRVVSNSWGSNSTTDKSFWKIVESWRAAGMVPSFAAGNAGPRPKTVGIPGGYPHAFAAGATDSSDGIASFSSRGPCTWDGATITKPDISAPGHSVISCRDGGGYRSLSGTSMACPHVSGLIALMLQAKPDLKVSEIETIIKDSTVDLGNAGHDNDFGRGRIDAQKACASLSAGGVAGAVKDTEGKPVGASIKVDDSPTLHQSDAASGKYSIRLGNGNHALEFSAFGYRTIVKNITVANNEVTNLDVTLEPVPAGTLTGKCLSKTDGKPVQAIVTLVGSNVAPVTAGPDGSFSIRAPQGKYHLVAKSRRYGIARLQIDLNGNISTKIEMSPVAPLLLVNASGTPAFSDYYARLLSGAVSGYDTHEISMHGQIDSIDGVYPYEMVVWFSGNASNSIPEAAQKALSEYMAGGGRILISGQDVSSGLSNSNFFTRTLHAKLVTASVNPKTAVQGIGGDPIGHGIMPFSLQGGTGANNQKTPDAVAAADAKASPILRWQTTITSRFAGLRVVDGEARAVYFGFGLEGVASDEIRNHLMQKSLAFLRPTARDRADKLARLTGDARADYIAHLEGWTNVHGQGPATPDLFDLAPLLVPADDIRDLLRKTRD